MSPLATENLVLDCGRKTRSSGKVVKQARLQILNPGLTFHAVFHLFQVAQRNPHEAGVEHQFVLVRGPHVVWGGINEENPGVPCGDLVVAD